jgi:transposase InsO family protein
MSGVKDLTTNKRIPRPIERFGNLIPTLPRKYNRRNSVLEQEEEMETSDKPASQNSKESHRSAVSVAKDQLEVQKKASEDVAQIEDEYATRTLILKKELVGIECGIDLKSILMKSLKEEKNVPSCTEDRKGEIETEVDRIFVLWMEEKKQLRCKEAELIHVKEEGERRIRRTLEIADQDKQKALLDQQEIDSDDEFGSVLNEDIETADKKKQTSEWAEKSIASVESEEDDEEQKSLTERLLKLSKPYLNPIVPPPKKQKPATKVVSKAEPRKGTQKKQVAESEQDSGALQMIAQALQALSMQGVNPASSSKLLARQVQGKDLPSFSGRPEEWPAFVAAYCHSTTNCGYSDADNLPRLQKSLKGEALRTVQCMLVNPASVPKAMEKLKNRFGRPEVIINNLIERVREAPAVKADRAESYADFGILVDDLTSTISSLGCKDYLSNPLLLQDLVKKLPVSQQLTWVQYTETNVKPRTLEVFAEWLSGITNAAFSLCPLKPNQEVKTDNRRGGRRQERVNMVSDKPKDFKGKFQNQNFKPKKCLLCEKPFHMITECKMFQDKSIDERWILVKDKKLCFGCIRGTHRFVDCRSKKKCGVNNCTRDHNPLLHNKSRKESESKEPNNQEKSEEKYEAIVNTTIADVNNDINFLMCPIKIKTQQGLVDGFAVLDNYSSITTIAQSSAKDFGFHGPFQPLEVKGFNSTANYAKSQTLNFSIAHYFDETEFKIQGVRTVTNMDLHNQSVTKSMIKKWPHLQDIPLKLYNNARPTILIGLDNPHLHIQLETRTSKTKEAPIAVRTPLGWMVMGNAGPYSGKKHCHFLQENEDSLHAMVKDYFTTESFGTRANVMLPRSKDDIRAQNILDSTLRRVPDGWEVGLLWNSDKVQLPESKSMAITRLKQMERKMDRNPEFAKEYCQRIEEYVTKGFAKVLSPEEARKESEKTFYVPHFMAFNPKKKKLRFVFDAAAKSHGRSLNDHLLQGPDKLVSLPGVLLNFRLRAIGVTADIKDFFHRVKLREEDAQCQRFLWRGMERNAEPQVLIMKVLIFGAACSPCCAQEARNKNAEEFKEEFPIAANAIMRKHYVDDYLDSFDTHEEAIMVQQQICEIHSKGGFKLCNWLSNSMAVIKAIPQDLRASNFKSLDMSEVKTERVLGLFWKPDQDIITFSLSYLKAQVDIMQGKKIPTKRSILSLFMSIYDPLGFLSILSIKARMILQSVWRSKIGWEDPIPEELRNPWNEWICELEKIPSFSLPRCYSKLLSKAEEVQLHVFGDGSQEAFGAVAYLRISHSSSVEVVFVMSKAKVAPLKALSIPRLELQAAVLGARLAEFIKTELDVTIHKIVYWSDSLSVIGQIRADGKRFQHFVGHRIGEIQHLTEVSQWRWIPTDLNVADEMTRFSQPCDWSENSRWIKGPSFLLQPEEDWPQEKVKIRVEDLNPEELELRKNQIFTLRKVIKCIDPELYSSYTKLIRVTAYVLRYAHNITAPKEKRKLSRSLTLPETRKAQEWWWRWAQNESYAEEIAAVSNNKPLNKSSRINKLSLVLDGSGVLRVRGRLDNASIPVQKKKPVVLDYQHPFTRLLIKYYHEICGHHGHERIANEIRQLYYIPGLRTAVRTAAYQCQKCKNKKIEPSPPEMGQLPDFRLQANVHPFHHTGLDYFGPVEVIVKRSREKRYVALFTCLSTRAIHLEVAHALSTDSCIMAIRRFVSRRGCPETIHSDNGSNFIGAKAELKLALLEINQDKITEDCNNQGIKWFFNPPSAPHMGGSWERLVKSVKVALGDSLQQKNLKDEVLQTLIIEAEHTVNSHPLTHVPEDPEDSESLTPNHFLLGKSSNLQPTGEFAPDELYGRKQWRIVQTLADHFWKRWVREYLPTLLRREKWCHQTKPIQVGDVVLEVNPNLRRNLWPKGRVIKIYPGADGVTRVVDIILGNGHTYKRPVAKLCILDVQPKKTTTM